VSPPDDLIEAFAAAVPFALREMAGVEAVVRESRPLGADGLSGDVTAVVRLTAAAVWRFALAVPEATAGALARRVLAGTVDEVSSDMVRDCLGEVANVVAGQAKTLLVGSPNHFVLSVPTVTAGGADAGVGGWLIRFESDAGAFAVHLGGGEGRQ
jgi:chemotaxis protein CheX